MSEHIKTGNDIEQELYRAIEGERETNTNFDADVLLKKKWVSLDWLTEKLDVYDSGTVLKMLRKMLVNK